MDTKEQIAVMTAYTEGKPIQLRRRLTNTWNDVPAKKFLWNWCAYEYRVKPENTLPKSWEEFCKNNPIKDNEAFIGVESGVCLVDGGISPVDGVVERLPLRDANLLPNKKIAESMLALCQLIQLRNCYNGDWEPDWTDDTRKHVIYSFNSEIVDGCAVSQSEILSFKNEELRDEFLENFRELIEVAKPLL